MNRVMESIISRRSIRKYTAKAVSQEIITQLLTAAMHAPSACNQQPWHFIVVQNKETLRLMGDFNSGYRAIGEAQAAIVVCGEEGLAKLKHFWPQDCSAATQNILVAANSLGLGALWMGVYPGESNMKKTAELLGLPERITPFSIVSIGYPAEEKPAESRFLKERVYDDAW